MRTVLTGKDEFWLYRIALVTEVADSGEDHY